ncbi:MAG: AAA family ATPase [Acholeplasmatales bacterium]|nr:AAA family ATPase [Acholeplasmatales bacterium]
MKKLILMGGDLASGKSTYSNIIGNKYNILVINKDNLKEILGDNILVNNREENKKLSVISFDLICYLIKKNMGTIIVESNFKPYEMDVLKSIVEEYDYDVLSLVFKGDNEILHKRFLNRLNENRHYVHKSQDFTNINDFINTLEELRNVKYIGKIINVNSSTFEYQNDNELMIEIEKFINN